MAANVLVCCRFRPPSKNEIADGSIYSVNINGPAVKLSPQFLKNTGDGNEDVKKEFIFDAIFDDKASQVSVYEKTAQPLVAEVFKGYNVTFFAYGQTGSGKTHTMLGDPKSDYRGLIPRMAESIFHGIEDADPDLEFTIKVSMVEIYNERIRDLLNPDEVAGNNLKIRETPQGGVYIQDVFEVFVGSYNEILEIMQAGSQNRAQAATNMNLESSRSHSVFILTMQQVKRSTQSKTESKLFLVDLAGSEKVAKTGASGQTLEEAKNINRSLSALGNVINALTSNASHIPYRDSKLTRLLSDSLGGNAKTCLIITCSPMSSNVDETISTLRFGIRAKTIKNKPKVNQERSVAEYKKLLQHAFHQIKIQSAIIEGLENDVLLLQNFCMAINNELPEDKRKPFPILSNKAEIVMNAKKAAMAHQGDLDFEDFEINKVKGGPVTPRAKNKEMEKSSDAPAQAPRPATAPPASAIASPAVSPPNTAATEDDEEANDVFANGFSPSAVVPPVGAVSVPFPSMDDINGESKNSSGASSPSIFHTSMAAAAMGLGSASGSQSTVTNDFFASLPTQVTSLTMRNAELEARLAEFDQERSSYQVQLRDKDNDFEEQKRDFDEIQRKLKTNTEALNDREKQCEILNSELELLKKKVQLIEAERELNNAGTDDMNRLLAGANEPAPKTSPPPTPPSPSPSGSVAQNASPKTTTKATLPVTPASSAHPLSRGLNVGLAGSASLAVAGSANWKSPSGGHGPAAPAGNGTSDIAGYSVSVSNPNGEKDAQIATLMAALKAKCDQFVKLRVMHTDQSIHITAQEAVIVQLKKRLDDVSTAPAKKIAQLESENAQLKTLLNHMMADPKKDRRLVLQPHNVLKSTVIQSSRIIMPLQGGGGKRHSVTQAAVPHLSPPKSPIAELTERSSANVASPPPATAASSSAAASTTSPATTAANAQSKVGLASAFFSRFTS